MISVGDRDLPGVLRDNAVVVVDCWASWCSPCRALAPVMEQIAAEYAGRAVVCSLNVEECPLTAGRYAVAGLPTILVFARGNLVDRIVGVGQSVGVRVRAALEAVCNAQ